MVTVTCTISRANADADAYDLGRTRREDGLVCLERLKLVNPLYRAGREGCGHVWLHIE